MKRTKSRVATAVCCLFVLLSETSHAITFDKQLEQGREDSLKNSYLEDLALKNPLMRQAQLSTEIIPVRKIATSFTDMDFIKGKARIVRNSFSFRLPLITTQKSGLNLSLGSFNQHITLTEIQNFNPNISVGNDVLSKTTVNLSLRYNTRTKLFNRPAFINTSLSSLLKPDFSESVLSGTAVLMINLKRNAKTNMSVGGALAISQNTKIPVFLMVSYEHHFTAPDLQLSLNLPYRISLRKPIGDKSSISFVNELSGTFAFYNIQNSYLPERSRYGTSEIKSMITFERRVGQKIILGVNAGSLYTVSSKMKEDNKYWGNSYSLKNKATFDPYLGFTISMLPFL